MFGAGELRRLAEASGVPGRDEAVTGGADGGVGRDAAGGVAAAAFDADGHSEASADSRWASAASARSDRARSVPRSMGGRAPGLADAERLDRASGVGDGVGHVVGVDGFGAQRDG
jgi:hypothetical protein